VLELITSDDCNMQMQYKFSALGAGSVELLHELYRASHHRVDRRTSCNGECLLQRLSVAIQRGNAASVLGTVGLESAESQ